MARKKEGYQTPPPEATMKLRTIVKPRSPNQKLYWDALNKYTYVFGVGPAGTGKTFLAVARALMLLKEQSISKIIITRPLVSNDEDIGFLPGDINEKMAPWTRPIKDSVQELVGARTAQKLFDDNTIEICPLSFMRGRTFKHSAVIADEMSNSTPSQMENLLTRLGEGSHMTVLGDPSQSDLPPNKHDGLTDFLDAHNSYTGDTGGLKIVYLGREDIQRHVLIPMILDIYGEGEGSVEVDDEFDIGILPK